MAVIRAKIIDPQLKELFNANGDEFSVVGTDELGRTLLQIDNEYFDFDPDEIETVESVSITS